MTAAAGASQGSADTAHPHPHPHQHLAAADERGGSPQHSGSSHQPHDTVTSSATTIFGLPRTASDARVTSLGAASGHFDASHASVTRSSYPHQGQLAHYAQHQYGGQPSPAAGSRPHQQVLDLNHPSADGALPPAGTSAAMPGAALGRGPAFRYTQPYSHLRVATSPEAAAENSSVGSGGLGSDNSPVTGPLTSSAKLPATIPGMELTSRRRSAREQAVQNVAAATAAAASAGREPSVRGRAAGQRPALLKPGATGAAAFYGYDAEQPVTPLGSDRKQAQKRKLGPSKTAALPSSGHCCTQCSTTTTPVWRAGPCGPKTLCNACGVRWMKVAKKK